jgi:hypothetical protein
MYYANYPGLHANETPQCEDEWGLWYTYHEMRWVNYAPPALDFPPASPNSADRLQTRLLQNYPHPFNPETWIPFELANDANVSIDIYDSNGVLVRTLALGDTPRGSYVNRDKAVHWDGKNNHSENVASGMYFYTLQTDNETATDEYGFAQTRRMVIVK